MLFTPNLVVHFATFQIDNFLTTVAIAQYDGHIVIQLSLVHFTVVYFKMDFFFYLLIKCI